jgi:hypothetical protein
VHAPGTLIVKLPHPGNHLVGKAKDGSALKSRMEVTVPGEIQGDDACGEAGQAGDGVVADAGKFQQLAAYEAEQRAISKGGEEIEVNERYPLHEISVGIAEGKSDDDGRAERKERSLNTKLAGMPIGFECGGIHNQLSGSG